MAEATLYFSRSKSACTPRTPAVHWEVARTYPNLWTPLTHVFLVMAHLTSLATNVRFFIVPCMRQSCVNRRSVLGCANSGRPTLLLLLLVLLLLLLPRLTPVLVCLLLLLPLLLTPVLVCGSVDQWYAVPPQYPQNANGQLQNDQESCFKAQGELKTALFGMCTHNPTVAAKPRHADTKADLIFKRVFCNYL